jgi:hypothetical protein
LKAVIHIAVLLTVAGTFMLVDTEYYFYSYDHYLEPKQQSAFYDAMNCEDGEIRGVICINYSPERLMLVAGTQAQRLLSEKERNTTYDAFKIITPCDNRAIDKLEMVERGPYVVGIVRLQSSIAPAYYMLRYVVACLAYTRRGQTVLGVGVAVLLFVLAQWLAGRAAGTRSSPPSRNSPLIMSSRTRPRLGRI